MEKKYLVKLDIYDDFKISSVGNFSQLNTNTCVLDFEITTNKTAFNLTNNYATIQIRTPSGAILEDKLIVTNALLGKATYNLANEAITERGLHYCSVIIYSEDNVKLLSSKVFRYTVTEVVGITDIKVDTRYSTLQELIFEVKRIDVVANETCNRVIDLESNVQAAETIRASNELLRRSNESNRESSENDRKTSESTRKNNELTRVNSENDRASSENTRNTNESNRVASETTRLNNETIRKYNETTRESSEIARKNNESQRVSNETARQSAESTRASSENTRNTNEAARQSAEGKRTVAEANRVSIFNENEVSRQATFETNEANRTFMRVFDFSLQGGDLLVNVPNNEPQPPISIVGGNMILNI